MNEKQLPTAKMTSVGASGAAMILIIWIAGQLGIEIPAEVAAAITTIAAWLAGYVTNDTAGRMANFLGRLYARFVAAKDPDTEPE